MDFLEVSTEADFAEMIDGFWGAGRVIVWVGRFFCTAVVVELVAAITRLGT